MKTVRKKLPEVMKKRMDEVFKWIHLQTN
jgi:hypothetical protein